MANCSIYEQGVKCEREGVWEVTNKMDKDWKVFVCNQHLRTLRVQYRISDYKVKSLESGKVRQFL